jgi:8-oxo-dGTP pyrophosphatase MutT (NUDIX family)
MDVGMEKWDVYDKYGNVTGKTKTRNDVFLEGEFHLGASLWIVSQSGKILLQKRSLNKRIAPGKWSITGGGVLAGENSETACIREVFEEIVLRLSLKEINFLSRSYGKNIIFYDYILIRDISLSDLVLQTEEVNEIKWASIEEIENIFEEGNFLIENINELEKVITHFNENKRIY